ncbi:hypothetical protein CF309_003697 [Enterobacter kobei]|nr:hypothetical protein [Enterobacter kobei]
MADLDREFTPDELLIVFRKKRKALRFHLGVRQKHIARQWLNKDTEIVIVLQTGRQTKDEDLARRLADEHGEKKWRRYLKIFSLSEWMIKGIRNDISEAEQYWEQGTSALESDPDHAVQLMLKAIALLDRGLKRSESAAGKRIKERHKLNSAYGGKVKATRFDGVKDEVIKHLEAQPEGWETKTDAINAIIKALRPYIEEHGWPSAQDKNDSRDAAMVEASQSKLLAEWSVKDKRVKAAFAKAVQKRIGVSQNR